MDPLTIAVIGVAALAVLVTGLLKFDWLSTAAKQVIALVVSVVGGVVAAYATGNLNSATDVTQSIIIIYGLQQGIYQFIFDSGKPLNFVDKWLEKIGSKTPPPPPGGDDTPIVDDVPVVEDTTVPDEPPVDGTIDETVDTVSDTEETG